MGLSSRTSRADAAEAVRICACLNLRRASRAVTRLFDEALQPSGLRATQFVVLVAIHAEGSVTLPALAAALGVERSALTRALKPLEAQGYVSVRTSRAGGTASVRLLAKGRRRLEQTVPLWQAAQGRFVERVGRDGWNRMLEDLGRVVDATRDV